MRVDNGLISWKQTNWNSGFPLLSVAITLHNIVHVFNSYEYENSFISNETRNQGTGTGTDGIQHSSHPKHIEHRRGKLKQIRNSFHFSTSLNLNQMEKLFG